MKNEKNHIKVLSALSIASSDTREDTLISVIIRTLYVKGKVSTNDISKKIEGEFNFEPFEPEINPIIEKLRQTGRVVVSSGNISLSDDEISLVKKLETKVNDEDKERFQNFKNFIIDTLEEKIHITKVKFLWSVFLKYIYDSFYEYGYEAIGTLHPYIDNGDGGNSTYEDILQRVITSIRESDESLCIIFKKIVEKFPDFASQKDLDFLNDLAQKTLSFSSLGLKPDLAIETIDHNIIDWVLYLDTNVLYSLLKLHSHPENQACLALVELIQSNREYIQIKLRYSDQTYRELGSKKADFSLLDDKMTDSAIKALLDSGKLDDFSYKFYQDLLSNRKGTIHPSKVIELSQRTLKEDLIMIGRTTKRLEKLGDEYIEKRMSEYAGFVEERNRVKQEFCKEKNITYHPYYRSERQIRHDISLREILLDSRKIKEGQELTLNNVKFFAITLDDLLITFDRSKIQTYHDIHSFPVFFKPSFLLNKLIKVLPIKTTDYKKAFIKAITTKGYNKNPKKSEDILKIVNYLKSKGIDDEKVIYNLISEDLFLEKFRENSKKNDFNSDEFIESELNREFQEMQKELDQTIIKLNSIEVKSDKYKEKNELLALRKDDLETQLLRYTSALEKARIRVKQLETKTINKKQYDINFEAADEREKVEQAKKKESEAIKKADDYKASLRKSINSRINELKESNLRKWQRSLWWNLFWVLPLLILGLLLIIPNGIIQLNIENENGETNNSANVILGVIAFLFNSLFIKLFYDRYLNEGAKKTRKENTIIPDDLLNKKKEVE